VRKLNVGARTALTDAEKQAYLDAELCIMETPASSGVPGAITRWDELQRAHAVQGDYIHGVVKASLSNALSFISLCA
jgi:hypothetical protein